jgi:peptide deformylase
VNPAPLSVRPLPIVLAPASVLSHPARPVDPLDADVIALAASLVATMRAHAGCVGLAANQVGDDRDVFCLDVGGHRKTRSYAGEIVLANARLVDAGGRRRGREGCLSVPDLTGDVDRHVQVVVEGVVPGTADVRRVEADGYEAVGLQHELDHLAGLLFLDRVAGAHAVHARRRYL